MFKLLHKKLNKKGFTLAELLVVVAIIAILIAIAVPIFTKAMREAQLRTNQGNMRSVKAAGVTQILSNWGHYSKANFKDNLGTALDSTPTAAQTWCITAKVTPTGSISSVAITGIAEKATAAATTPYEDGIAVTNETDDANFPNDGAAYASSSLGATPGIVGSFATKDTIGDDADQICNISAKSTQNYVVLVYVTDVDFLAP